MITVYYMLDPATRAVRYVGQCADARCRWSDHLRSRGRVRSAAWIKSLRAKNLRPIFQVVAIVETREEAHRLERALIKLWRERGADLTNLTDGGEGNSGYKRSPEQRARMIGRRHTAESIAKIRATKRAQAAAVRKQPPAPPSKEETRVKRSAAKLGHFQPQSERLKRAASMRAYWEAHPERRTSDIMRSVVMARYLRNGGAA